ncbi:MAG: hypothetical protein FJ090_18565, partial [Deltaproteobacteria bacterium]|nr:hypothetical protein [Deltaproteobacteria bacterium]
APSPAASKAEPPRGDAAATALASAVSAAVAKVGRGVKPAPSTAPLPPAASDEPIEEAVDDLAAFADYDTSRAGGDFISDTHLLDRVELFPVGFIDAPTREPSAPPAPPSPPAREIFIEMEDAENASKADLVAAVSLNFAGPKLDDEEARAKIAVLNEVLDALVATLDAQHGAGHGQSRAQLLVECTPGAFAALFKGVEVDSHGLVPVEGVLKNLRRRPASEHRRLLNRGLNDLFERALSLASEELDDKPLDAMLEKIAGYQQRLGL